MQLDRTTKVKLEVKREELNTILASLGESRENFYDNNDEKTGDWLQNIRLKLIEQAQKQGLLENYFRPSSS
jgi:hypothetical protein